MDQRVGNLMTIHKALHPSNHIDYKCQEKKEGGYSPALKKDLMHLHEDSKIK